MPRTHGDVLHDLLRPGMDSKLDNDNMATLIPRIYGYIVLCTLAGASHRIFEFVARESFMKSQGARPEQKIFAVVCSKWPRCRLREITRTRYMSVTGFVQRGSGAINLNIWYDAARSLPASVRVDDASSPPTTWRTPPAARRRGVRVGGGRGERKRVMRRAGGRPRCLCLPGRGRHRTLRATKGGSRERARSGGT